MKSIKLVLALLISTSILSSCMKGDDTPQEPAGLVYLVNGYTPQQSVSYFLDGRQFHSGQYANAGRYWVSIGQRVLSITASNNAPIADTTFTVEENATYTTYLYGSSQSPQLLISKDLPLTELGNRVALRFIHMANGLDEEVDFYIGDEKISSLSDRTQETKETIIESQKFTPVNSGTFDIWIKDKEGNKLDSIKNASLQSGGYYSLNWVGTHEDDDQPLKIIGVTL